MTPSPNRLLNITLHDSYFKGLRTKLLCDGHTNNTGGNGAGKTSALQLIPIFYGCQPNQVMSRVADKKGFLDYYLPRNQSLIVFEYTRPDGICCAILFRNPTNQLNYCFIKANADESIFSPQLQWAFDNSLSSTEIIKELRNLKIEMSKLRTTTDYASIIGKTKRIAKDSSLMTEASQFSLSNTEMKYMGDLTNVLLSETQLLKKLKTMLAETLLSGIKLAKTPIHTQNESLLDSFEMLSKLDTITADMSTAKDLLDTIRHDKSQLFNYQNGLYHNNDEFHQHKAKIIDKKEKNLQEKNLNFEDYNVKKAEIAGQITVLESQLNAHKKQLDTIVSEETSYQKSQINIKIADYDKLPQHRATLENLQKDLNFASQSANSIIEQFQRQQLAVKQDFSEQLQILNHNFSHAQEQNRTDSQALNTQIQTLSEQEKSERQALTHSQHQEAIRLNNTIHQHELQREQVKHLTPEEQDILQTYSEQEASLGEQIAQFERDKIEQSQQKQHNQQQLHTLSKEFDEFSAKIEALARQQSELHDSLYSDGTLLAFLRDSRHDNASNWHTIAKVIDPALFMSKNLNPMWHSEPSPTQSQGEQDFYGLIIDTENLPLPKQAEDTELLQTQLQQVIDKITHLKKQQDYKEKQIFDMQQKLKEITAHESISISNINDLDKQRKILTQETQAKRQAFAEHAKQRQADITEQIEALKNQQSQLQQNHQLQIDEFNQRFEQKQQTLQQKQNDLNNSLQQAKQQFEQEQEALESDKQRRLNTLTATRDQALNEQGIDNTTITTLETQVANQQKLIKKIKDYYEPIQAYHYWQENILTQKDALQDTILLGKNQINDLIRQQNAHHDNFKMSQRRYEQNDDSFVQEIASLENKLGVIAEITDKINLKLSLAVGENVAENFANPPHPMPFEVLVKSANDKLASLNQGIERSIKIAKNSHNALTGKLYETWEMRMQKYHRDDKFSTPYYLSSLREMVDMMVDEIPTQRQATLQAFRTLSHGMTEYYEQLHAFHKRVTAKSNEISKEINHNHGFTALNDITISLTSVLFNKGQDELRKFVEAYHDEIGSGNLTVLPSLALRQSFKQAIIWLEGNKFDTENTASLIELNIRYKENNREVVVRHDEDLTKGSSTGLSILLITVIFASLTRYLCPDDNTIIHWSIDEIGKLDDGNIKKLFTFMDKQKVQLFCVQPNPNPVLNKLFVHKNDINRDIGVRHYINHTKPLNPQLAQTLLKVN